MAVCQNMISSRKYQWVDYSCLSLSGSRNRRQYRNRRFLAQEEAVVEKKKFKTLEYFIKGTHSSLENAR